MSKRLLGYEFLRDHFKLSAFPCARPARVGSVTKVVQRADALEVPASVAPSSQDPLEHLLFALKHEGVNLQILAQCKRKAFLNKGYSPEMLAVVESVATGVLTGRADDGEADDEIDIAPYRV